MMLAPTAGLDEAALVKGLTEDPLSFTKNLKDQLGDFFSFKIGSAQITFVNDPLAIEEIFADGSNYKKKRNEGEEGQYLGMMAGICAMFTPEQVNAYTNSMSIASERALLRLQELADSGSPVDVFHEMMRLTLEIQIESLFSLDLKLFLADHHTLDLGQVCRDLMAADRVYGFDPVYAGLSDYLPPFTIAAGSDKAKVSLLDFAGNVIESFNKNPKENTLLAYLTNNMPHEQVKQTILVLLGAHHEVAVPAISRALQVLGENPSLKTTLTDELNKVLGGRVATQADLPNLTYTQMFLHEVRRLYPCVWMVMRWSREERILNGFTIPKDSVVMMSQWVSHHDSSHFSNPELFDPARWSDENIKKIQGVPYFPFSKGIRSCAGEQFAEIQDAIILATIAQSIDFTLCPGQNLSPLARRSDAPQEGILCTLARH